MNGRAMGPAQTADLEFLKQTIGAACRKAGAGPWFVDVDVDPGELVVHLRAKGHKATSFIFDWPPEPDGDDLQLWVDDVARAVARHFRSSKAASGQGGPPGESK